MPVGIYKHKPRSEETKRKISETRLRKKQELGYLNSPETRKKMSEAKKGKTYVKGKHWELSEEIKERRSLMQSGEGNNSWTDNPGYGTIHMWLSRTFGRANHCEFDEAHESNNYDWAKKREVEHERKRENYLQLCRRCHSRYDRGKLELKEL